MQTHAPTQKPSAEAKAAPKCACHTRLQRKCDSCQNRDAAPAEGCAQADGVLHGGGGQPLSPQARAFFEPRFGFDFGRVRVHADDRAARSARSLDARAYTVGTDIVFGAGAYAPETKPGQRLLAHELAHVVQQAGGSAGGPQPFSEGAEGPLEADADRAADAALAARPGQGAPRIPVQPAGRPGLQRQSYYERALGYLPGRKAQMVRDLVASVREAPQHVGEFLKDEVWEAVKAHWGRILAVTVGLIVGEELVAILGAAPTGVSQVIAVILQILIIAILGYFAAVELKGAVEAGIAWFTTARDANGDPRKITEASRSFVRMVWHIIMAILVVAGVRARIKGFRTGPAASADAGSGAGAGQGGGGAEVIDLAARRAAAQAKAPAPPGPSARSVGPSAFDGNAARALPEPAEVPAPPAPQPAPPPPAPALTVGAAGKTVPSTPGVQGGSATAAGISAATSAKGKEKEGGQNMMRHQIQQGAEIHYSSVAVMAPAKTGVTALQLRAAMAANYQRFMRIARGQERPPEGWTQGPVRWEPAIVGGIVSQSQALGPLVARGGVTEGGNIRPLQRCFNPRTLQQTNCATDDVRLDIENRGHNLRS